MATVRHLRNAPIVEAIVEFQVDAPAGTSVRSLERAHRPLKSKYPRRVKQMTGTFQFQLTPANGSTAQAAASEHVGYRFISGDGKRIAGFTMQAFAFHWLRPYTRWEELRVEAQQLWKHYRSVVKPKAITRIGVRYINNLAVPVGATDLGDYLVPGPIVPDGLPQAVKSFLSRIEIVDEANQRIGIITQAFQGLAPDGNLSVLLDVDTVRIGAIRADDENAWLIADRLRVFKNDIFFRCVTDRLLEQYI